VVPVESQWMVLGKKPDYLREAEGAKAWKQALTLANKAKSWHRKMTTALDV